MPKNVFITGANGGFGRLTTSSLLEAGHTVVATMRNIETRNLAAADELRAAGAHVVELDVTDDSSVDTAMANAVEFDINVFGVQRVNRAALPLMRATTPTTTTRTGPTAPSTNNHRMLPRRRHQRRGLIFGS